MALLDNVVVIFVLRVVLRILGVLCFLLGWIIFIVLLYIQDKLNTM